MPAQGDGFWKHEHEQKGGFGEVNCSWQILAARLALFSFFGVLLSFEAEASCEGFGIGPAGQQEPEERRAIRGQFADNDFAGEVLFSPGSAELSWEAGQRLRTWLDCLHGEGIPVFETYIVGHSDITGHSDPRIRRQRNQELSEARARSVYQWLQSLGFRAQGEVTVIGRGESELLCLPGPGEVWTPELHRCNRRVEIFISNVEDFDPQLLAEAYGIKLDWEADPTRTRFDLGETLSVNATLHHPGGFDPQHAPDFMLAIGDREMNLSRDRRPVDGEQWRASGRFELDETGRFELNVAATLGQMRAEGRPRTIEVDWPEFGLALQPVWDECPACDASTASVVVDELPERGFIDLLPIRMLADTERIQLRLEAEGLPEGIRLVGPGRLSLDHANSSSTVELTRTQLAEPLVLQSDRNYQPDLGERTPFLISLAHPESDARAELEFYLERAHEFGLYTDDSWDIDLTTMHPNHHQLVPMVDGQRIRIEPGFELSMEGLPVWSRLRPVDDENETWIIEHQLPWWMSPAFVATESRTLNANLLVGGSIRASDQIVFEIQSSVPRWRLWLDWLLKVLAVLLALLWLLGMWRKPRFDKSASITRENPAANQVVSRPLRAAWFSRYLIPFKPERARLFGLTWLAGTNRGHVMLVCPKGVKLELDGPENPGSGQGTIMIWPNQAVAMEGRPNSFYYEVR